MSAAWHVLGAGSIGSLFACALHEAGENPVILSKNDAITALRRKIIVHQSNPDRKTSYTFSASISRNSASSPIQKLLVTTKAYDVHESIRQVAHRLNERSVIIILVNGMGFLTGIQREFPSLKFAVGTTTEGAYRISTDEFCHAGRGITRIGQAGRSDPPDWFSSWEELPLKCTWAAEIEEVLWQKLAVNCAINPLTAKHRCKNGDLALPAMASQVQGLCNEIVQVSRAAGYMRTADNIHRQVREVIAATADNKSSMLQDVLAGRRTEIDYISGYFLKCAKENDLAVPLSAALCNDIQALDRAAG